MKKKSMSIILALALSGLVLRVQAQSGSVKWERPLDLVKTVADRIVKKTPFKFQLVLQPTSPQFDFVKYVDMGRTFGKGKPAVAYALTNVKAKADTALDVGVSHNDCLKIWLNDKVVYERKAARQVKINPRERDIQLSYSFKLDLKKGNNRLLVKSETAGGDWIFYLQPQGSLIEERHPWNPQLGVAGIPNVSPEIAKLTNWLVIGPFTGKGDLLDKVFEPEKTFDMGKLYAADNQQIAWTIPKVEVLGDAIGSHPLWGTYYNWNYHSGGVAWAMGCLAKETGDKKYGDFLNNWTDFMLERKSFVQYQVDKLNAFQSVNHQLVHTPLLDFTTAPAMPLIYRLNTQPEFKNRAECVLMIDSIKAYVTRHQIRLPAGNFTRETPRKFTTWADDMFMGIPFLLQSAQRTTSAAEKQKLLDDAAQQIIAFNQQVFDTKVNLYQHVQYSTGKTAIPHWSRANGWGIWATSEVLLNLPKDHPQRNAILEHFRRHVDALVKLQDLKTGFWHNVLDRPDSYNEFSGTAIFTMAIARGINNGWLDRKMYAPSALSGWKAIDSFTEKDGTVHGICVGTMSSEDVNYYLTRPVADNDSHGMIGLIFAGIEMERLVQGGDFKHQTN